MGGGKSLGNQASLNWVDLDSTAKLEFKECYSGTPLNRPPLGPVKVSLLEGWPHLRGEFVLKSMLFGLFEVAWWPHFRGPDYNYFL